jgi:hypothetical protein
MNDDYRDFIRGYSTCIIGYGIYSISKRLYKQIKKFFKQIKIFKTITPQITDVRNMKLFDKKAKFDENYLILEGECDKLFTRYGNEKVKNIIISEAFTTYYEDFFLNLSNNIINSNNKVFVQPYQKTKLINLNRKYIDDGNWFYRIIRALFFEKNPVLEKGDKAIIFGKIIQNKKDIIKEFSNYYSIKAKYIYKDGSYNDLVKFIKKTHIKNIFFNSFVLGLLLSIFYFQVKSYIIPGIKRIFSKIKKRMSIYCKECKINPCNIMCEKCENIVDYCDNCYIKLQEKINRNEIRLEMIKCPFCNKRLDACQKLMHGINQ